MDEVVRFYLLDVYKINRNVKERTFGHVLQAKLQNSLCIRAAWSESSLGAFWNARDAHSLNADEEDSNQTARMRRLIKVFVGRTCQKVTMYVLSQCCSNRLKHNINSIAIITPNAQIAMQITI